MTTLAVPRRIGILGGTFNPVHYGHLRAAEEVLEIFALDRVLFVPAALPPHKKPSPVISVDHRLRMARLASAGRPGFEVSDVEASRSGPSFTVDTLTHFRKEYGPDAAIFFLTGLDAFLDIETWRNYKDLFKLANMAIMSRPGWDPSGVAMKLTAAVSRNFAWDAERQAFTSPGYRPVHFAAVTHLDISSTDIRRRQSENLSIRYLLPESVREYILANGLYRK